MVCMYIAYTYIVYMYILFNGIHMYLCTIYVYFCISLLPAVQYSLLKELKEFFPLKINEFTGENSSVSYLYMYEYNLCIYIFSIV